MINLIAFIVKSAKPLVVADVPEELVERLRADLKTLDPNLGVYPYDVYGRWLKLTNHLTGEAMIVGLIWSKSLRLF